MLLGNAWGCFSLAILSSAHADIAFFQIDSGCLLTLVPLHFTTLYGGVKLPLSPVPIDSATEEPKPNKNRNRIFLILPR